MSASPVFKSPLTDVTGCLINHQQYDKCGQFEMDMMECLEAYGLDRGKLKCKLLIEDFQECSGRHKQQLRIQAMQIERKRQYDAGLLKTRYEPAPKTNAY